MPEPAALPVHCAHCGGQVTLQLADWPSSAALHDGTMQVVRQTWTCLYCHKDNGGHFHGRLTWVTKGHNNEKARH